MSKLTIYKLKYYHYSEGAPYEELGDWLDTLRELMPEAEIEYEATKPDYGIITVSVYK